jgi:leucyl/phenylalanyl-tRNA--protein transferase
VIAFLDSRLCFPDPNLANEEGLVAVGGDFSTERLLLAYRAGIFPWTVNPITWWSPDPRAIMELDGFHVSRSFERTLRKQPFALTVDKAFRPVMEECARPTTRRRSTWITREFVDAYTRLHQAGHAHSIECWLEGQLVGGVYGVAIGGFFAGESMFCRVSDASKVALFKLTHVLRDSGFALFDIQMLTPITRQLGGCEISRTDYLRRLRTALQAPAVFGSAF